MDSIVSHSVSVPHNSHNHNNYGGSHSPVGDSLVSAAVVGNGAGSITTANAGNAGNGGNNGGRAVAPKSSSTNHHYSFKSEAGMRRAVEQLTKSLGVQRSAHTRDVGTLNTNLSRATKEITRLEEELDNRERQARSQVLLVKQLRRQFEEIELGNQKLAMASDMYSDHLVSKSSSNNNNNNSNNDAVAAGEEYANGASYEQQQQQQQQQQQPQHAISYKIRGPSRPATEASSTRRGYSGNSSNNNSNNRGGWNANHGKGAQRREIAAERAGARSGTRGGKAVAGNPRGAQGGGLLFIDA